MMFIKFQIFFAAFDPSNGLLYFKREVQIIMFFPVEWEHFLSKDSGMRGSTQVISTSYYLSL